MTDRTTTPEPEDTAPETVELGPEPVRVDPDVIDRTVEALTTATRIQARRIAVDWGYGGEGYHEAVYDQLRYLGRLTQATLTLIDVAVTLGDLGATLFVTDGMDQALVPPDVP